MNGSPELLVILGEESSGALERVAKTHRVIHVGSPRVVVVEQSAVASDDSLESVPGVAAVAGAQLPPDVTKSLSSEESLFVSAWFRRMADGTAKERAGEGMSWDAPGFTPPDPPGSDSH